MLRWRIERLWTALLVLLAMVAILALFAVFVIGVDEVFCHGCSNWGESVERNYP
ncbi:hypothetical protein LCGC14_1181810 [marine sediment metagenome]|uniref:Uncharacterized protein n=1 Tax=marine sediment metagenome TaxID=412755 RepID=A0A0F9LLX8_9ZZZZ